MLYSVKKLGLIAVLFCLFPVFALADDVENSVAGLYKAVLYHDDTESYQYAEITLRTINPNGQLSISANVKIIYGEPTSNEFFTYEFDKVPLNLLTREISIQAESNEVSLIGTLKDNEITGEWFSTLVGRVGHFIATKGEFPEAPQGLTRVETLSGYYQGSIVNENPQSNLPERVTFSFVTTQSTTGTSTIVITGNTRLYLGDFNSLEYVELVFNDVQFNFYNRYLSAKTAEYGLTFKGYLLHDGTFDGEVFSDGIGKIGPANLAKIVGQ